MLVVVVDSHMVCGGCRENTDVFIVVDVIVNTSVIMLCVCCCYVCLMWCVCCCCWVY